MVAEIVCVGSELLLGDIVNTNAQHISKELAHIGIDLYYQTVVGDNKERVWNVLDTALKRSDLIIMTGGLGPTKDDLTKEVAASFFGKKLVYHEQTYEHVRKKLESYGINEMTESQKKQALVPEGSLVVTNPAGLAPGFIMAQGDKAIVMLPGPPKEMKAVLAECCHLFINRLSDQVFVSINIKCKGPDELPLREIGEAPADLYTENLNNFRQFVLSLGSIALILDYREHDHATAAISHLPHMIAYSLVNLIEHIDSEKETMKTIAAGGFRDVTRIAASSPVMWENICESNKTQLLSLMDQYEANFHKLREIIAEGSSQKMIDYFQDSKNYRDSLTLPGAKIRKDFHEIFVDIADEAGGIAVLASLLAFNGINIKNIGIINNREFEEGVLRIEFYDEDALESAISVLKERNYTIHRR